MNDQNPRATARSKALAAHNSTIELAGSSSVRSKVPTMRNIALAAILTGAASIAAAQGPPSGPVTAEKLTPNAYWVHNVGFAAFIVGDKGVIAIDTGRSTKVGSDIVAEIAKVTPKPINTLLLTHCDADHINGIAAFPTGIPVIVQVENEKYLKNAIATGNTGEEGVEIKPDHMPTRTVRHHEDVTLDGVHMQLLNWGPAHTSGDLVVYLPAEKLVLAGDVLVMDQHNLPLVHLDKGGTSKGWITTVRALLALDATKYVVGHEGYVGKDALELQLKTAVAEREKIKVLYDKGSSLADIQAAVNDPIPPPPGTPKRPPHFPPYSEVIYQELKAGTY